MFCFFLYAEKQTKTLTLSVTGDWNGDGKAGFILVSPKYSHSFLSKGDGKFSPETFQYPHGWNFGTDLNHWAIVTGDWNGDGKTDFMRISAKYCHPYISKGDGTFETKTYHYPHNWNFGTNMNYWAIVTGDWNGDGKTDFMRIGPHATHPFLSKGNGSFTGHYYTYPDEWNFGSNLNHWAIVTGDWNGDGKTDFMRISTAHARPFLSKGDGTFLAGTYDYPADWTFGSKINAVSTVKGDWNGGKLERGVPAYEKPDDLRRAGEIGYNAPFIPQNTPVPSGWHCTANGLGLLATVEAYAICADVDGQVGVDSNLARRSRNIACAGTLRVYASFSCSFTFTCTL